MFPTRTHSSRAAFTAIIGLVTAIVVQADRAAAQDDSASKDANQPAKQEILMPCLAVAADGTPVWASTSFPPCKRLTAVFRLGPEQSGKTLASRWVAGEGDNVLAENTLDLNGQKSGWLQLQLKQPAPPGKYRLQTTLDGKPWQSVDITIIPPIEKGKAEKPSDLIPLVEDKTMRYDLSVKSGQNTTIEIPNVKPGPDGISRATLVMAIGKKEDAGTHYTITINDKPVGEMWVKLDEAGLQAYRKKEGDQTKDLNPPVMINPLPPRLEDGIEWTSKTQQGNEQKLQFFGPLPVKGPEGPTTGYVIVGEEQTSAGSPGTEAVRGKETTERYYIPTIGLVREVHVNTVGGTFASRQEIALASNLPYKLVANPNMKGRLGRVQFSYPPDTKSSEARVAIFKAGAKPADKPVSSGYGAQAYDLMPGKYDVAINNKRIPVEVKSGHDTIPLCGVLRIHAGSETRFKVLDADKKTELHSAYGEQDIPLPIGTYLLEIAGATESIKIEDGKVTEF